eukprot:jgi/Mesen1/3572/ME000002S05144
MQDLAREQLEQLPTGGEAYHTSLRLLETGPEGGSKHGGRAGGWEGKRAGGRQGERAGRREACV